MERCARSQYWLNQPPGTTSIFPHRKHTNPHRDDNDTSLATAHWYISSMFVGGAALALIFYMLAPVFLHFELYYPSDSMISELIYLEHAWCTPSLARVHGHTDSVDLRDVLRIKPHLGGDFCLSPHETVRQHRFQP